MNELSKQFIEDGDINTALQILRQCREQKLFSIGRVLGTFMTDIFTENAYIIGETALCAYFEGNYELCRDMYNKVLQIRNLSPHMVRSMLLNQRLAIKQIMDNFIHYNSDKILEICNQQKDPSVFPLITFTITSCKRLHLFEMTMNSFINCCEDLHLINRWICIDDNSSEQDRQKMTELYPFFEFYFKTPEEKGHANSLNILQDMVNTPFVFHMEDDWKFVLPHNYITHALTVLEVSPKYGQCLFNKNYGEIIDDLNIAGGEMCSTLTGRRYIKHEYCSTQQDVKAFAQKYDESKNCAYWPHFSLRPCLLRTKIWKECGKFNTEGHFEMEYAYRYVSSGFVSVFFEGIYCVHTGRLTKDRNDITKLNAYDLNCQEQFGIETKNRLKSWVINMKKRPERLQKFNEQITKSGILCEVFYGVDGTKLEKTEQLCRIFEGNDYNMRQGIVGCALSHIKLLINIISSDYDMYLIFEDDAILCDNFDSKLKSVLEKLSRTEFDLCFLGHHAWNQYKNNLPSGLVKWNASESLQYSMGGTFAYIITKEGAKKMLEFINNTGMTNAIDTMMQKSANTLNCYYYHPSLCTSKCATTDDSNTDIQYNFDSVNGENISDNGNYPNRLMKDNTFNIKDALHFKIVE